MPDDVRRPLHRNRSTANAVPELPEIILVWRGINNPFAISALVCGFKVMVVIFWYGVNTNKNQLELRIKNCYSIFELEKETGMSNAIKKRHEMAEEYKWKLEDVYANEEVWEEDFKRVQEVLPV